MDQTPFKNLPLYILIDKAYFWSLCIIAITLPVKPFFLENILSYSMILFIIMSLCKLFVCKDYGFKRNSKSLILFLALFLWWAFGLVYSLNLEMGLKLLETKLGLILIPLFVLSVKPISLSRFRLILLTYALSVTFFLVLSYLLVLWQNYSLNGFETIVVPFFLYHSLVHFIGMQAIYMAIQVAFSLLIVIGLLARDDISYKSTFLLVLWLSFLLFALLSLTVKMVIIAFVISVIAMTFFIIRVKRFKILLTTFVLIAVPILLLVSSDETAQNRLDLNNAFLAKDLSRDPDNTNGTWGSLNLRIALAQNAIEVIKDNLIFGTGIGDEKDERRNIYIKNNFLFAQSQNFNEHNQYLNNWLSSGLIGLSLLMAVLLVPLYKAIRSKEGLYVSFIVLIMLSFLAEVYLSRLQGVVFFSFFNVLFFQQLLIRDKTIPLKSM